MPRPARTRVVSARAAKPAAPVATRALAKPPADEPSSDIYGVSDRETRKRRGRASAVKVLLGDISSTSSGTEDQQEPGDARSPPVEAGRKQQLAAVSMERTTVSARTCQRGMPNASALDVMDGDLTFGNLDSSFGDATEDSPAANQSSNTSSFNVGMFKRRPRQSSIVGKDDGPIRPSSRGQNTTGISSAFTLGNFKRRAREPSILGTARKQLASRAGTEEPAAGDDEQDEEDLEPDAESTPLNNRRRTRSSAAAAQTCEKRVSPRTHMRKRKSLEDHGGPSKRLNSRPDDEEIQPSIEVDDISSPPIFPRTLNRPSTPIRPVTPEYDPEIMAPPASSSGSSSASPVIWPSMKSLARTHGRRKASRTQKTPVPEGAADEDDLSDISSPPSLTHSPNYRSPGGRGASRKRDPSPVVKTSDLAAFLPQRRHRGRKTDLFGTSDSDGETDGRLELHRANPRPARPRKQVRPLEPSDTTNRGAQPVSKDTAAPVKEKIRRRRTYGSRNSDKENQDEEVAVGDTIEVSFESDDALEDDTFDAPEDTTGVTGATVGQELKQAAKKFKEVDRWELEFEEVAEPSSPNDAR